MFNQIMYRNFKKKIIKKRFNLLKKIERYIQTVKNDTIVDIRFNILANLRNNSHLFFREFC